VSRWIFSESLFIRNGKDTDKKITDKERMTVDLILFTFKILSFFKVYAEKIHKITLYSRRQSILND